MCSVLFLLSGLFSHLINASSYRAGVMFSLLVFVLLLSVSPYSNQFRIKRSLFVFTSIFTLLVTFNYIACSFFYSNGELLRFILSIFLLVVMFFCAALFVNVTTSIDESSFHWCLYKLYWILLFTALIIIILSSLLGFSIKNMFFVSEPSHFALFYTPFLCYVTYFSDRKILHIGCGFFVSLTIMNLTMLVGVMMCCLILTRINFFRFLCIVTIFALLIMFIMSLDSSNYFASRLTFSADSTNLSALVFMSGWERAYLSLIDSNGIGVGFQQMGINGPQGFFMDVIIDIYSDTLNKFDGGAVGAKLITEMGGLGVTLLLVYIFFCVQLYRRLHFSYNMLSRKTVFYIIVVLTTSLQIFVRGTGYFSPLVFLFMSSIYYFISRSTFQKRQCNPIILGYENERTS